MRLTPLIALVTTLLLSGCGIMPEKPLPDSKILPPAGNAALKAIVASRGMLDASFDFIASGVRSGAIEPKQGRSWYNELVTYKGHVAEAQKLLDSGGFDLAKAKAEATEALIKFVHDSAIEALRKAAEKPAAAIEDCPCILLWDASWRREIQPTSRRLPWTL